MDSQWIDEFHHALRISAGGEKTGYYSDFSGLAHLTKAYNDAYVYSGQYSEHRQKKFGRHADASQYPGKQFVVFSQNHDQVGNRMLGERSSRLFSLEMQKLMAGAVLTAPFLPMLWMGEEWSEPNPFLYFVSHTDQALNDMVRKGRKEEFAAFHAQGEAPDPVAQETFDHSKLQWHIVTEQPHKTMLEFYCQLIKLRVQVPALKILNRKQSRAVSDEKTQTLTLHRIHEAEHVIILMNFSESPQQVAVPTDKAQWKKLFDSADPKWHGPAAAPENLVIGENLKLMPQSFVVYINK